MGIVSIAVSRVLSPLEDRKGENWGNPKFHTGQASPKIEAIVARHYLLAPLATFFLLFRSPNVTTTRFYQWRLMDLQLLWCFFMCRSFFLRRLNCPSPQPSRSLSGRASGPVKRRKTLASLSDVNRQSSTALGITTAEPVTSTENWIERRKLWARNKWSEHFVRSVFLFGLEGNREKWFQEILIHGRTTREFCSLKRTKHSSSLAVIDLTSFVHPATLIKSPF